MQRILTKGKLPELPFRCETCGQEWMSDEWLPDYEEGEPDIALDNCSNCARVCRSLITDKDDG